jgi:hypothetical protein
MRTIARSIIDHNYFFRCVSLRQRGIHRIEDKLRRLSDVMTMLKPAMFPALISDF